MQSTLKTLATKSNKQTFWLECFSLLPFFSVLKLSAKNNAEIIFHSSSKMFLWFFKLLNIFFFSSFKAKAIDYSLGDMKSESGEAIRYEVEELSAKKSKEITDVLTRTKNYRRLQEILPSDRLRLYFEKKIKYEIYPVIRTACIINYYKRNNGSDSNENHIILWPASGVLSALQALWPYEEIRLAAYRKIIDKSLLMSIARRLMINAESYFHMLSKSNRLSKKDSSQTRIGIHFYDGIDLTKRNEIFWFSESYISPERIVYYFDNTSFRLTPASSKILDKIEAMRMSWVFLRRNPLLRLRPVWAPRIRLGRLIAALDGKEDISIPANSSLERWIYWAAKDLLFNFAYWKSFYTDFNIKIDIDIEEAGVLNVCKAIALDSLDGIMVGFQRSEMSGTKGMFLGLHPHHVLFTWNKRGISSLADSENINYCSIISGYCYDYIFKEHHQECFEMKKRLNDSKDNFIVAFYDNIFGSHSHFSINMMEIMYRSLLHWLLQDEDIVLILKPKKAWFLRKNLPDIYRLIDIAQEKGQCIVIDSPGCFPSYTASACDIAVGIGISSALLEAVLAGARGVMCDLTCHWSSPFYALGHNRIIFENVELLLEALKKYKADTVSRRKNDLGDFSPWLDLLDPFRDGNAHKRIGRYISDLFDSFESSFDRKRTIDYANRRYREIWGNDKVVEALCESDSLWIECGRTV